MQVTLLRNRLLHCLLVCLFLCLPLALSAQTLRLASVQIAGSERLPVEQVAAASGLTIGQPVTLQDLKSAADRLAGLGLFEFVTYRYETTSDTISVTFVIEETAQFRPCEFDNFVWLSREELVTRLKKEIPLFIGEAPPGGYLIEEITQVLQEILHERGIEGRVVHMAPFSEKGGINRFRVEGVSIPVTALQFLGAEKLGEEKLRKTSRSLLGQPYSRSFLGVFIAANLLPLYRSKGYLTANFDPSGVEYMGEAEGAYPVRLVIPVEEGEIYRVRELNWSGNEVVSAEELTKHIHLQPGNVADTVQLADDLRKIREEEYGSRGYIRAQLRFTPELDDETRTAVLTVHVEEGELYRFQSLAIKGLRTKMVQRLARKWKLKPGDPYDSSYAKKFMKDEVDPLVKRLTPRPRHVNFSLDRDDEQKTVAVILRFR